MWYASVDIGNGMTNAAAWKGSGKIKTTEFASVRAQARGKSLGLGKDMELDYTVYDMEGRKYLIGEEALLSRVGLDRHTGGSNRYGNEFAQFLTACALAQLGVKGDVHLTTFIPPGLFADNRHEVNSRYMQNAEVKIVAGGKTSEWTYTDCRVLPEGLGAIGVFTIDDKFEKADSANLLAGNVVVLDLGSYTADALLLTNGKPNTIAGEEMSIEGGGVDAMIRKPLLAWLKEQSDEFSLLQVEDVDAAIRSYVNDGVRTIKAGAASVDISKILESLRLQYAEWVSNTMLDSGFQQLRNIKSVILVGGGVLLVERELRKWYPDKIIDPNQYPAAKKVHPGMMNAIGGLRLTVMQAVKS